MQRHLVFVIAKQNHTKPFPVYYYNKYKLELNIGINIKKIHSDRIDNLLLWQKGIQLRTRVTQWAFV